MRGEPPPIIKETIKGLLGQTDSVALFPWDLVTQLTWLQTSGGCFLSCDLLSKVIFRCRHLPTPSPLPDVSWVSESLHSFPSWLSLPFLSPSRYLIVFLAGFCSGPLGSATFPGLISSFSFLLTPLPPLFPQVRGRDFLVMVSWKPPG